MVGMNFIKAVLQRVVFWVRLTVLLALLLLILQSTRVSVAQSPEPRIFLPVVLNPMVEVPTKFGDIIREINGPGEYSQGLAWDGSGLWVFSNGLARVNPQTGAVLKRIPLSGDIQDITWDGEALWAVDYGSDRIYRLSPDDGRLLHEFSSPGDRPIGIAWDGSSLWHSDENGRLYKLDPVTGSVQAEVAISLGNGTTMLAWDGSHLWVSAFGESMTQYDINTWQLTRTLPSQAEGSKGIAWVDGALWNGGVYDDKLYLIDATPGGSSVASRVVKEDAPLAGALVEIWDVSDPATEMLIGAAETDINGMVEFDIDLGRSYEYRGFGDMQNDELWEWVRNFMTDDRSQGTINLPDVDVFAPPLLEPAADATFSIQTISASNPVELSWAPKDDAIEYWAHMRNKDNFQLVWRGVRSPATNDTFDGTTIDSTKIDPGKYFWYVGLELPGRWFGWSPQRIINFVP